ncbi:MAG: hypothetical protein JW394_0695 [Nitrospira sp.]|nr:hypothetical protein [Nitrospira sp.]
MRALTLYPEWAWAVCRLGKRIENRERPAEFYGFQIGERFAIHAGAHIGGRKGRVSREEGLLAVTHAAKAAGLSFDEVEHLLVVRPIVQSAVVATATYGGFYWTGRGNEAEWEIPGRFAHRLHDVIVLPNPVPTAGERGLWTLRSSVLALVQS